MKPNSSQRCTVTEQEATDKSWNMENSLDKDVCIYIFYNHSNGQVIRTCCPKRL